MACCTDIILAAPPIPLSDHYWNDFGVQGVKITSLLDDLYD